MSQRELKDLLRATESRELTTEGLRSGTTRTTTLAMDSDSSELEKTKERLAEALAELATRNAELERAKVGRESAEEEARTASEQVSRLEADLRRSTLEAEVVKLREVEALRKDFDVERRFLREDREREAASLKERITTLTKKNQALKQRADSLPEQEAEERPPPESSVDLIREETVSTKEIQDTIASEDSNQSTTDSTESEGRVAAASTVPNLGTSASVMDIVAQLLEAQRMMMTAQVQALATQTVPPLRVFTGENINSDDDGFERWLEQFEERARLAKWTTEQQLFQLKAHLGETAEHVVRMLSTGEKSSYDSVVKVLRRRFRSLDIEELRGLEFHQLMQNKQSVEGLGVTLQKLARKAFPESGEREFDRLLKGRFYQALLPKWQCKLGAPRASETFEELYARARTLERHDQQLNAARGEMKPPRNPSHKAPTGEGQVPEKAPGSLDRSKGQASTGSQKQRNLQCYHCGQLGHFERNCPKLPREAPGKSGQVSAVMIASNKPASQLSTEELEELLARRQAEEEQHSLGVGRIGVVTSEVSDVKGPVMQVRVSIEGFPVEAVVDTGAQCTVISRSLLRQIAQHMHSQGRSIPQLRPPSMKLYGRGGKNCDELLITAEVLFQFSLDSCSTEGVAFVHPESEIPCLLGMNVLPHLGIRILRSNGEAARIDQCPGSLSGARVCLLATKRIQGRKSGLLEVKLEIPVDSEFLIFQPDHAFLQKLGLKTPDALFKQQPEGTLLIPVENQDGVSTRLEAGACIGIASALTDFELESEAVESPEHNTSAVDFGFVNSTNVVNSERVEAVYAALGLEKGELTDAQFGQLKQLVRDNVDVFALEDGELGHTSVIQHHVDTGDHVPIREPARRVPFIHRKVIASMVEEMEQQGVVRPSVSPWASPVVLVPKKDGTKRFCVDYRRLNGITRKDVYPLPRIDDIMDTLGGSRYFTSLDLASGYWQVELDAESAPKSAFATHCGLYEFARMPFGMCNAPATFQRLMEVVLSGLLWKECFAYLDDVLVCSRSFQEHLNHLQKVLLRIRTAGLRLKAKKCKFLKPEVSYLGGKGRNSA